MRWSPLSPLALLASGLLATLASAACQSSNPPANSANSNLWPAPVAPTPSAAAAPRSDGSLTTRGAAQQFARWVSAFNAGDRAGLLDYHREHFPYAAASADVADIERELRLRHGTGGFVARKQEDDSETRVTVLLQARKREAFARATMEVEPRSPHRVVRFEIGPVPKPPELREPDEPVAATLSAANRAWLIEAIAREFDAHYVFPEVAKRMVSELRAAAARGEYDGLERGPDFANRVHELLRRVSGDGHVRFEFGPKPNSSQPPKPGPNRDEAEGRLQRWREENFRFGEIERMSGNVARVVIHNFLPPDPAVREAIAGFMSQVADADALIFDLRTNRGGSPETVAFVASYVFDAEPVHLNDMYRREDGTTTPSWTLAEVPGKRLGSQKPVYVLTSRETFSGGEELTYDLQALRRALVIGETTGGGANPTEWHQLSDWFRLSVPWGRPINPVTKTNWEGAGVKPDVSVPAGRALETAHARALKDLAAKRR